MKIERMGMIDYEIWRIGIFVFINRFFFSVFAIKFLCNFINFPKIDRFRKIASTKRNQIDTVLCMFPGGRAGPGRAGSGRVGSGRVVYRFSTINSKHALRAIISITEANSPYMHTCTQTRIWILLVNGYPLPLIVGSKVCEIRPPFLHLQTSEDFF